MTVSFGIDPLHLGAEEFAVCRSVTELVDGDVIMDHLMQDRVFDQLFRQVDPGVDTQHEILIAVSAEEPLFAAGKSHFAEKALRVGEFDGDWRQRPAEIAGIELVKAGLDIRNRWFQIKN